MGYFNMASEGIDTYRRGNTFTQSRPPSVKSNEFLPPDKETELEEYGFVCIVHIGGSIGGIASLTNINGAGIGAPAPMTAAQSAVTITVESGVKWANIVNSNYNNNKPNL